ncbi:hypothetical protein CL656_05375 [bacterium]|nr:hypothetical protein [bacterium]|tara:strand:- start:3871 stop:4413 length:543 start_codon:yes stop_codon:yes gene_type:complete
MKGGDRKSKKVTFNKKLTRNLENETKLTTREPIFNISTVKNNINFVRRNTKPVKSVLKNSSNSFPKNPKTFLNELQGKRPSYVKDPVKRNKQYSLRVFQGRKEPLSRSGFNEVPEESVKSQYNAQRKAAKMSVRLQLNKNNYNKHRGVVLGGKKRTRKTRRNKKRTRRNTKKRNRKSRKN